jgi:hypothetical protein
MWFYAINSVQMDMCYLLFQMVYGRLLCAVIDISLRVHRVLLYPSQEDRFQSLYEIRSLRAHDKHPMSGAFGIQGTP